MTDSYNKHGGSADAYFNEGEQSRYIPTQQAPYAQTQGGYQAPYGPPPTQYQAPYGAPPPQQYQAPYAPPPTQQQYAPPPPQQQQYSAPPQPPPTYNAPAAPPPNGPPMNGSPSEKQDFNQAFTVQGPKYNDIWAALLFLATFAGFVVVSGISIQGYSATKLFQGGGIYGGASTVGLSTNTIILFAFVLAVAFILSLIYFWMIRAFTKQIIWITGILQIVFGIGTAAVYFARHQYGAAIVFLIFAVFYIICFISWIPRIPFSVLMLEVAIDVAKNYGHVFVVSLIGGLIATAFGAWFSVTLVAIYAKYEPGNNPACSTGGCSTAKVIGLVVFVTFAAYWITEVLKNIMHVTISGVYGSWYFCSQKPGGFPKGATRGAFKRSMTYSFGSISFGSLLVAIIQLLRQACTIAQQNEAAQGNIVGQILFCVLGCLIGLLDWAVQFINEYAFSYIALYGKSYIQAAKVRLLSPFPLQNLHSGKH
jgi:hypothetical protein